MGSGWATQKLWRQRNPIEHRKLVLLYNAKERAKRSNLPFEITKRDIVWPECCPVLGIPLNYLGGSIGPASDSPSLDRVDPRLGYVKGNVMVISVRANRLKGDCVDGDELRRIAFYIDLFICDPLATQPQIAPVDKSS